MEGSRQSAATPALAGEGRSGVAVPALDRDSTDGTLRPGEILALDRALARLEDLDPQEEKVFELRCFAGLDDGGIAEALGVPAQSVARDWAHARSWVCRELARAAGAIG